MRNSDDDFEEYILPVEYNHTPIRALRPSTLRMISQFLNLKGVIIAVRDKHLVNNYTGLAELIGFAPIEILNIKNQASPTEELLEQWMVKERCENATVGNFWSFLYQLERFDVLQDCRQDILYDCRKYDDNFVRETEAENWMIKEKQIEQAQKVTNSEMTWDETKVVSVDDVRTGKRTQYHVYILYETKGDLDRKFVRETIGELEAKRGLKLFVPSRDDLPGSNSAITVYIMEKRCRCVVIIMSRASSECNFQTKLAQALALGAAGKKLIPVVIEKNVHKPRSLELLDECDFTESDMKDWAWDRLYNAIVAPIPMVDNSDQVKSESSSLEHHRDLNFPISRTRRLDVPNTADQDSGNHGSAIGSRMSTVSYLSSDTEEDIRTNSKKKLGMSTHVLLTTSVKIKSRKRKDRFVGSRYKASKKKAQSTEMRRDPDVAGTRDYRSLQMGPNSSDAYHASHEHELVYERNESVPTNRGPVENVDLSRRISNKSKRTSTYGGHISTRSPTSSESSSSTNEVKSSSSSSVQCCLLKTFEIEHLSENSSDNMSTSSYGENISMRSSTSSENSLEDNEVKPSTSSPVLCHRVKTPVETSDLPRRISTDSMSSSP